jgi:hypothetical protein
VYQLIIFFLFTFPVLAFAFWAILRKERKKSEAKSAVEKKIENK